MKGDKTINVQPAPPPLRHHQVLPAPEVTITKQMSRRTMFEKVVVHQRAWLEIRCPGHEDRGYEINKDRSVIGRGMEVDIMLPYSSVSREHAIIHRRGEECSVEDLDSTNGTYVNGTKIVKCILRNGDQIQIGDAKMLFVEEKIRGDQ